MTDRTRLLSCLAVCCCISCASTAAVAHIPRTSLPTAESTCHTCMISKASVFSSLSLFSCPVIHKRRAVMHITVYTYPHITGGQTGKKKATAYLQSLVSTVHANILSRLFCLLFTHFLPLFSPSFHPVFTPFLSFSIAFAPNNLIDRR